MHTHEAGAYVCDPQIVAGLKAAVERIGQPARLLPSGAGHDTMIMGALCPAGMLFMRCKGGISHNPLELITRGGLRDRLRGADGVRARVHAGVGRGHKTLA